MSHPHAVKQGLCQSPGLRVISAFGTGMVDWTWPDDTGHMWEVLSPHLSCIPKQLKIKASPDEVA